MRIDLTNYNAMPGSSINIYRRYNVFTEDNCPPVLVTLPVETKEYHDTTVELNRLAYYRVGIVHNTSEIIGPMYTTIKKFYTGPQVNPLRLDKPDMILRGDAKVGRYGSALLKDIYPIAQIPVDFPEFPWVTEVDYQNISVEKCIFEDRILFISDAPVIQGSLEDLYKAGTLFASGDGSDQLTPELYGSIATKVTQGRKVHANGFTYRYRLITDSEFSQLYVKLFPTSVLGNVQERVIANCIPHDYTSPVLRNDRIGLTGNKVVSLNGTITNADWTTKFPLFLVLELVSRSDTAFPEPGAEIKPTLPEDRMMYCNAEVVNNRVHFFGGIYSRFNAGSLAIDRHVSFDLNGEDEQIHAPMPTGVYKSVTWVHDNKIYCFGGVKQMGSTEWSFLELYNDVQVWEDDGTPEGTWTVLTSNVTYGFDSCGTVYHDSGVNKDLIFILGGYDGNQAGITDNYYYADVKTFNGTFESARSYMGSRSGGGAIHTYAGDMMMVAGTRLANGYTNAAYKTALPINPPASLLMSSVVTQGTELPTTKGGKLHIWRDTLFFVTSASIDEEPGKFFVYQWAPNESRWLKVTANVPELNGDTRASVSPTFHNDRIYVMLCQPWLNEASVSKLLIIDLKDPLGVDLVPINSVNVTVNRIYPPYAKVVNK